GRQEAHEALRHDIESTLQAQHNSTAHAAMRVENDFIDLRTQQKGALARLKLIDEALEAQTRAHQSAEQKAAALFERFGRAETEPHALGSVLQEALARLAERLDAFEAQAQAAPAPSASHERLADFATRLDAHEQEAADAGERAANLSRLVGKLS